MKRPFAAVLLFVLAAPVAAADPTGLAVEVDISPKREVQVFLRNDGPDPVTVITDRLQLRFDALDTDATARKALAEDKFRWNGLTKPLGVFSFDKEERQAGVLVVPSATSLHLVTLQKGEKARLAAALAMPMSADLRVTTYFTSDLERHANAFRSLSVRYEVSEFWGKRLGVWHGTVQGEAPVPKFAP